MRLIVATRDGKKATKTTIPQSEQVENSALKETFLLIYSCILMLLLPSPCKEWSAALPWEGKIVMALCEKQWTDEEAFACLIKQG